MKTHNTFTAAGAKPSVHNDGFRQISSRAGGGSPSARSSPGAVAPSASDHGHLGAADTPRRGNVVPPYAGSRPTEAEADDSSPDWAASVDLTEEQAAAACRPRLRRTSADAASRRPSYRLSLQRDDAHHLLDETNFQALEPLPSSLLKQWMKRSQTVDQLGIEGFAEKVAIAASSTWGHADWYLRCSPRCNHAFKLYPCHEPDLCPICHNIKIGDPLQQKFSGSFGKARHWYAFTFAYDCRGRKARLKLVARRNAKGREIDPQMLYLFNSSPDVRRLVEEDVSQLEACGQVPFQVLEWMRKRGVINGAVGGLDLDIEFFPVGSGSGRSVGHGYYVHVHALVNCSRPITWERAQRIYGVFCRFRDQAGLTLYPDLHISALQTAGRFRAWLRYTLKPLRFEKFYFQGAAECADRPGQFNDIFDQVVFNSPQLVYGAVKTPRFYGNMRQQEGRKQDFIGVWQYRCRLKKEDYNRLADRVRRNLPITPEEEDAFWDHTLYLTQQAEQRQAREERKRSRRKRAGRRQDV